MTRQRAIGACAAGWLLLAGPALAHTVSDPTVVVVVPRSSALEIRINEMAQPGEESIALRRRFDGDRNGRLDDSEASDLGNFLVARATLTLAVSQAGKALPLHQSSHKVRGVDRGVDDSGPVSVDVILEASPLPSGGRTTVEITDHRQDEHPVRANVLPDGVKVLRSSRGELSGDGVVTGVTLDRQITWTLEYQ